MGHRSDCRTRQPSNLNSAVASRERKSRSPVKSTVAPRWIRRGPCLIFSRVRESRLAKTHRSVTKSPYLGNDVDDVKFLLSRREPDACYVIARHTTGRSGVRTNDERVFSEQRCVGSGGNAVRRVAYVTTEVDRRPCVSAAAAADGDVVARDTRYVRS